MPDHGLAVFDTYALPSSPSVPPPSLRCPRHFLHQSPKLPRQSSLLLLLLLALLNHFRLQVGAKMHNDHGLRCLLMNAPTCPSSQGARCVKLPK